MAGLSCAPRCPPCTALGGLLAAGREVGPSSQGGQAGRPLRALGSAGPAPPPHQNPLPPLLQLLRPAAGAAQGRRAAAAAAAGATPSGRAALSAAPGRRGVPLAAGCTVLAAGRCCCCELPELVPSVQPGRQPSAGLRCALLPCCCERALIYLGSRSASTAARQGVLQVMARSLAESRRQRASAVQIKSGKWNRGARRANAVVNAPSHLACWAAQHAGNLVQVFDLLLSSQPSQKRCGLSIPAVSVLLCAHQGPRWHVGVGVGE